MRYDANREQAADDRRYQAVLHGGGFGRSQERQQENNVRGNRQTEEAIVELERRIADRSKEDRQCQRDMRRIRYGKDDCRCSDDADDRSGDARNTARERCRKVGAQDEHSRQGDPIAALNRQDIGKHARRRERYSEANRMPPERRAEMEMLAQHG